MSDLLDCPFCGGRASLIGITATGEHSAICISCGGETSHKATQAEAIAAWNTRTHGESLVAMSKKAARYDFIRTNIDFEFDKREGEGRYWWNDRGDLSFECADLDSMPSFESVIDEAIAKGWV